VETKLGKNKGEIDDSRATQRTLCGVKNYEDSPRRYEVEVGQESVKKFHIKIDYKETFMVPASTLQVGDLISDRGLVTNVRYFASPVTNGNSNTLPDGIHYYLHVANEMNSCYSWVVDRVVVETTLGTYCFLNDTLVSVIGKHNVLLAAA
jgi:hypothetical protein